LRKGNKTIRKWPIKNLKMKKFITLEPVYSVDALKLSLEILILRYTL